MGHQGPLSPHFRGPRHLPGAADSVGNSVLVHRSHLRSKSLSIIIRQLPPIQSKSIFKKQNKKKTLKSLQTLISRRSLIFHEFALVYLPLNLP